MIGFLLRNWLWIVLIVFFVGMHRTGHGCGMHGGHRHGSEQRDGHRNERGDGATANAIPDDSKETHSEI